MRYRHAKGLLPTALLMISLHAGASEEPASGAPYVPSPHSIVTRMLTLANTGADDYVIDLGSGDGRIVLTAAKLFGARGLGVELRADLVERSRQAARRQGVEDRVRFEQQDLFATDISEATLVTVYLLPETLARLRSKLLRELSPGTRVLSHDYPIDDWRPERFEQLEHPDKIAVTGTQRTNLYLYRVPADVEGDWQATVPPQLSEGFMDLRLTQAVTSGRGEVALDGRRAALDELRISGRRLHFRLPQQQATFTGTVTGGIIEGVVLLGDQELPWRATRQR